MRWSKLYQSYSSFSTVVVIGNILLFMMLFLVVCKIDKNLRPYRPGSLQMDRECQFQNCCVGFFHENERSLDQHYC